MKQKKIQNQLTPEAFNHVFETGTSTMRTRRFDINSNRLRSYAAAVSQRFGNPQDSPTDAAEENPNEGMIEETAATQAHRTKHDDNIKTATAGGDTYTNGY